MLSIAFVGVPFRSVYYPSTGSQLLTIDQLSQKGRHEDALARMDEIDEETLRNVRYLQYWTAHIGLLKLRRYLHR